LTPDPTSSATFALASEADAQRLSDKIAAHEVLTELAVAAAETTPGNWEVVVYFTGTPDNAMRAALHAAAREFGSGNWQIAPLPEADWVAMSHAGLPPVRVGRFLVHGAHARAARRVNDIAIEIEAAEAFGTGHHGTTAGCLAAMAELSRAHRFRSVLDLGSGSGVLAIAAAKLWHASALATDIDPRAAEIAAANARANNVGRHVTSITATGFRHPAFEKHAPFDLILANILARPLTELAPALARHLAPGGSVVLSGLLPGQQREIVAAYRNQSLRLARAATRDGWLTLTLRGRNR
jgi:ribosomal protein L11 methyltransferase